MVIDQIPSFLFDSLCLRQNVALVLRFLGKKGYVFGLQDYRFEFGKIHNDSIQLRIIIGLLL